MAAVQSGVFTSHQKVRGFESHRTITPSGPFRGSVRRYVAQYFEQPRVNENRHGYRLVESDGDCIRRSTGVYRSTISAPKIQLSKINAAMATYQPDRDNIDIKPLQNVGHQFVGKGSRGRNPAQCMGEAYSVLEPDRE